MVEFRPSQIFGSVTVDEALSSQKVFGTVTNVAESTLTTILTKTANTSLSKITVISVSGDNYAKFTLVINGITIDIRRTGPDRNLQFDFTANPLETSLGDVIDVKVEHFNVGETLDFDATIYGYGLAGFDRIWANTQNLSLTLNAPVVVTGIWIYPATLEIT